MGARDRPLKRLGSDQPPEASPAKRQKDYGPTSYDASLLSDVRNAITLKGSSTTEAIMRGYKDVENRAIRLPIGWIALHNGKGQNEESLDLVMRRLAPGLPPDADRPKGYVLGVCWIERAVKIDALRAEFACTAVCNGAKDNDMRHIASCTFTPHAGGPFCNVVSASIRLDDPVPCQGGRGMWKLPDTVRSAVLQQLLHEPGPRIFDFRRDLQPSVEHLPRPWPCPWAPDLTRADVYWHRDLVLEAPGRKKQTPAGQCEGTVTLPTLFLRKSMSFQPPAKHSQDPVIDVSESEEHDLQAEHRTSEPTTASPAENRQTCFKVALVAGPPLDLEDSGV